ncbi:MAG: hypothetical protein MUE87_05840 [Methanothrix sp.]|nr:hypothetical protein [Methanothrix sp.]
MPAFFPPQILMAGSPGAHPPLWHPVQRAYVRIQSRARVHSSPSTLATSAGRKGDQAGILQSEICFRVWPRYLPARRYPGAGAAEDAAGGEVGLGS